MNSYSIESDELVSRRKFKLQKNLIQNFNKLIKAFLRYEKKSAKKGTIISKKLLKYYLCKNMVKKKPNKEIRLDNKTQTTYDSTKS